MKRLALAAILASFFAVPALASQCPSMVAKIDEALAAGPELSAEQLAEVQQLRDEGEAAHAAGDHAESEALLGQAMGILGIAQ